MPKPSLDQIFGGASNSSPSLDEIFSDSAPAKPAKEKGVLDAIDSYTGAPTRALVGGLQQGKGILGSLKEFGSHFGADTDTAPTGHDIQKGFGIDDATLKQVMSGGSGMFKLGGLLTRKDDPVGNINFPETLINAITDYSNLIPVGKGLEAAASVAGKGAKALKLGELATKGGELANKALESEAARRALLSGVGLKTYGLEGLVSAQLLDPVVKQAIQGGKKAGKGLLNALKTTEESTQLTKGPFTNFPPKPGTPLLETVKGTKSKITPEMVSGLLREELTRERLRDE